MEPGASFIRYLEKTAGESENSFQFRRFIAATPFDDWNGSVSSSKPRDSSIFAISAFLHALEVKVNSTLQKFHCCKMTEKEPKTLIKS